LPLRINSFLKTRRKPTYLRAQNMAKILTSLKSLMSLFKKYVLLVIVLLLSKGAFGQAARSPFSTFGIGEPYGNALIHNQAMGGIGVSQPQYWFVNNQNPALLVFNYYTVFQAGMLLESRTVKGDTTNRESVNGNMNYLVTAFPVKAGKWSTSIGLMPFTNKNYRLEYYDVVADTNPTDSVFIVEQGSGGLSQLYWSNGVRIHDNWSVGIKAAYLFGSVNNDYTNTLVTVSQPVIYTIGVFDQTYVKDFQFTGGLSFSQDSIGKKDEYRISAGLTYAMTTQLKARRTTIFQRRNIGGTPITSDTLVSNRGDIKIPSVLTAGVSISKGSKWSAGMEFTVQDWSQFENIEIENNQNFSKSWRFAAGGDITPDQLAESIFKRITYRAGLFYEKSPFLVNNNDLLDFGINFGLAVPAGRSSVDLAFSTGKRGDRSKNVLEETYFKVYFGLTFNDQWFVRRKFD
jgi:hypothetical protein